MFCAEKNVYYCVSDHGYFSDLLYLIYADGSIHFQELGAEISDLEKQRDELEAQLKKVLHVNA